MQLPPTIAIHGVGTHAPDQIKALVDEAFRRASVASDVSEFNWDAFIDHSVNRIRDGVAILDETAVSITNTAALPLPASAARGDGWLQRTGDVLYSIFRIVIATALTLLILGPVLHVMVLLPSAAFTPIALADFAWIRTATYATILLTAGLFVVMLGLDLIRSLIRRSPAPLLVTFRRGALLLLQPLILLLTIPVSWRFGTALIAFVAGLIPIAVFGAVLNLLVSPLFGSFNAIAVSIGATILLIVAAALVGGFHVIVRQLWIGGPLKVLLDIVRYLGSPTYRTTLQRAFDERIHALDTAGEDGRRVVLLAHSLGSVIALDSLINSTAWRTTDSVHLVTLGSPIKRSFIRFFPGYLFPPSIDRAARVAAARLDRFSWINIHRPWDYVGTGLGLERAGVGEDLSTRQGRRVFSSHSNYWGDEVVVATLEAAWQRAVAVDAAVSPAQPAHVIPVATPPDVLNRTTTVARTVSVMLLVAVVGVAVSTFLESRTAWLNDFRQELSDVAQSGTETLANVTYHRTVEGGGEETHYVHHFLFQLSDMSEPLPPVAIEDRLADQRFDYRALADFVLAQCQRREHKRWWQIFKSQREIPCTRPAITLRYNVESPEAFWLPQFPPRARRWDGIEVFGLVVLGVFFVLGSMLIIVQGGVRLFRLFLGLTANE
jgi:hypothetical protein